MWLSYRKNIDVEKNETGLVTIPGEGCAVLAEAELRDCSLLSPGGYYWSPDYGDQVMVLPAGGERAIAGVISAGAEIQPGEVYIKSKGGSAIGCYLNFLETENAIFLPVFGIDMDKKAVDAANHIFNKTLVPININEISEDGGVLNCISWEN